MILDNLLVLLDKDETVYPVLDIYKNRAITVIKNYLNVESYDSEYIETTFADAIIELVYNAYIVKGKENIQSESQGSRSIVYKDFTSYADSSIFTITQSIKALLPLPSVKMMG